jgi:hypothetical protein
VVGDTSEDQKINWYGFYAQDQWRVRKDLVLSYGIRYDYITPPTFSKINSGLDVLTGIFHVTGPVLPLFPKAVGPSSYYSAQTNGWQPRFGFVCQPHAKTAIQGAFVIIDDHNNTLIEEQSDIRLSWPSGIYTTIGNQDNGYPSVFINTLPAASTFLDPNKPLASFGGTPDPKIPYSLEWNLGVEQQLLRTLVLGVRYVASGSQHQFPTTACQYCDRSRFWTDFESSALSAIWGSDSLGLQRRNRELQRPSDQAHFPQPKSSPRTSRLPLQQPRRWAKGWSTTSVPTWMRASKRALRPVSNSFAQS